MSGLEHSAHFKDRSNYKWCCREWEKYAPGIHAIWGITSGDGEDLQSIRFDAKQFTIVQAQAWLVDHDFVPLKFEAAEKPQ